MDINTRVKFVHMFYRFRRYNWACWSWLYRWIFQSAYVDVQLPSNLTPEEATEDMDILTWTKDSVKELWDSIGLAQWVQHCLVAIRGVKPQPKGALDCDDYSEWAESVLDPKYRPRKWCLSWVDSDDELQGHAMCMGQDPETGEYFHIGNWGYMGTYPSFRAMVEATLERAGAKRVVAWAILKRNLFPESMGLALPEAEE